MLQSESLTPREPPPRANAAPPPAYAPVDLALCRIDAEILRLVPESTAREHVVLPLAFDGETLTLAAADPDNIALADRLRFLLAKDVRLAGAPRDKLSAAINRHYGAAQVESVDSLLQACDEGESGVAVVETPVRRKRPWWALPEVGRYLGKGIVEFKKGVRGLEADEDDADEDDFDLKLSSGGKGMFFYVVEEGQRVLMRRRDGTVEMIVGPRRLWRGFRTFHPMRHHIAHPGKYLVLRYRDGREEHIPGPADVWLDPRVHAQITVEDALHLAAKEAVVVYSSDGSAVARRIVFGPALFVPRPGEWLHTFSWHASKGGSKGLPKEPNALVFQKLWLTPDQMYHDVTNVRTADDAVLTVRLMIFFELADIERMLDATRDPIGDFVNAATSDVVAFTGRHDFEHFKRNTGQLNELETYRQLTGRAAQCGYRINKVVYRGYGSAEALQQMHDQAIQARTRLQLDRATEQQAQDLENYKLDCQLARAGKRRTEQVAEVEHDLALARTRQQDELRRHEAALASAREARRLEAEVQLAVRGGQDGQQRDHLAALRELGVDLTAYLTQGRADQVIELRGGGRPHVHLDRATDGERGEPKS